MTTTKKTARQSKKPAAKPIPFEIRADGQITLDCEFDFTITDQTYPVDNLYDDINCGRVKIEDRDEIHLVFTPDDGDERRIGTVKFSLCSADDDCLQTSGLYNFFSWKH